MQHDAIVDAKTWTMKNQTQVQLKFTRGVENGWRVAPKSFKDYVSQPKKSGYQALQSAAWRGALIQALIMWKLSG
jgi:hypothetical protein